MRPWFAPLFVALFCVTIGGCAGKKAPPTPPPATVTVATPLAMNVIDWDDYVGQFVAVDSVDVRPRVSGYLVSVGFRDGDYVAKGQTLFVIDPRPYQAALDQAKGAEAHAAAALTNAQTQAARGQALLAAKAISQQAYDTLAAAKLQAAADLVSAQAAVKTAALNLSFTRVTAPMSGRVSDRRIAPGNLVAADATVLTNIVNLDPDPVRLHRIRGALSQISAGERGGHPYILAHPRQPGGDPASGRAHLSLEGPHGFRGQFPRYRVPARSAAAPWSPIPTTSSPPACSAICGFWDQAPIRPC